MCNTSSEALHELEEDSCERFFKMQNTNLLNATLEALKTGELAPIIKEELKYTIQSRRLAKGQKEMKVEFTEKAAYELTEEEKEKVIKRKEQNRQAAQRFRERKKQSAQQICKNIEELEAENRSKMFEIRLLRTEKANLQLLLQKHLAVCPLNRSNGCHGNTSIENLYKTLRREGEQKHDLETTILTKDFSEMKSIVDSCD